jgi:hypothetical protein
MLTYKRKPNSGKMHIMGRKGGSKSRASSHKILRPGDEMIVAKIEDLPGYPHSMDGWELLGGTPEQEVPNSGMPRREVPRMRERSKPATPNL